MGMTGYECYDRYKKGLKKPVPEKGLFFHDEPVRCFINLIRFRPVEQVERIDLHVDLFGIIKRLVLFFTFIFPENDNPVLHLFAADNFLHTVRSGAGGNEDCEGYKK
jgi:hypothetical protein